MIKESGRKLGEISGALFGKPVEVLGEKLDNEFLKDLGGSVRSASAASMESAGGAVEGLWKTSVGLVKKDKKQLDEGLSEIKDFSIQTGKGFAGVIKETVSNGESIYKGIRNNDREQLEKGAKGLAKTAALSTLVVTAFDFADGADQVSAEISVDSEPVYPDASGYPGGSEAAPVMTEYDYYESATIDTRNEELAGSIHPETGVSFFEQLIQMPNGEIISGVFPDFNETYSTEIPDWMYQYTDTQHFQYANMQLSYSIGTDPQMASQFTAEQLHQIASGETPSGLTWHHSEIPGRLELVNTETHAQTGHTGGRELWGGGESFR